MPSFLSVALPTQITLSDSKGEWQFPLTSFSFSLSLFPPYPSFRLYFVSVITLRFLTSPTWLYFPKRCEWLHTSHFYMGLYRDNKNDNYYHIHTHTYMYVCVCIYAQIFKVNLSISVCERICILYKGSTVFYWKYNTELNQNQTKNA